MAKYKRKFINTSTVISFFVITLVLLGVKPIQASEMYSLNSLGNSQSLVLLSPNFAVVIPGATGGPSYNENHKDILKSNVGSLTGDFSSQSIEDTNGISLYIVKNGDTLSEIAELFDVSVNTIKWENNIGNTLKVGQELRILPVSGVRHTIKKGDTFGKIANIYNVEIEDITVFNNIDATKLSISKKIIIPNGVKKSSVSTETKTSTSSKKTGGSAQYGYYTRPTPGVVTSRFGPRWGRYHYGIDFGGTNGVSPIVAAASGVVEKTYCGSGYGNCLVVKHNNGTKTLYAHLNVIIVSSGTSVKKGQKIGTLGRTGNVTGPHLHFEIIKANGQKMNPNSLF